jgi:hypothetical protein
MEKLKYYITMISLFMAMAVLILLATVVVIALLGVPVLFIVLCWKLLLVVIAML